MRRKWITVAAIYAAAAITVLGIMTMVNRVKLNEYRRSANYGARHSLEEAVTATDAMSAALEKSIYATDGNMCGKICAEVYADALAAQASLAALPFATQELEQISGFLGVAGDYAYALCSAASDNGFTDEQSEILTRLSQTAAELADALREIENSVNDGLITMDSFERRIENVGIELDGEKLSEMLLETERAFPEQQTPEYDGKYSAAGDGEKEENTPKLSEEEMLTVAAEFAGVSESELKAEFDYEGESGRRCYSAGETTVCISPRGVESMASSRLVSDVAVSADDAEKNAERFLKDRGYESLRLSGGNESGGIYTMRYISVADDVLLLDSYLDISVALDDGSIYAFSAENYEAEIPELKWTVTPEQAETVLPKGLTLAEVRKVVIKSPGGSRVACYELNTADENGRGVRIYVDAITGRQREIELDAREK